MTTLDERVHAAVTARLELARAATPGPWRTAAEGSEGTRLAPDHGDHRERVRFIALIGGRAQPEDGRNARHIAAWDPAMAIRICEHFLSVLERHAPRPSLAARLKPVLPGLICCWCTDDDADVPWPCPEVLGVAQAIAVEVDGG